MGKFCTKCGRPLQEGEICTCQQPVTPQEPVTPQQPVTPQEPVTPQQPVTLQTPVTPQAAPAQETVLQQQMGAGQVPPVQNKVMQEQAVGFLKDTVEYLWGLIIRPVTTGKKMIMEANVAVSAALIILQAIMSGFFAMAACGKYSSYVQSIASLFANYSSSLGSGISTEGIFKMPFARIFIVTVLLSVVLSLLLAAMLLLGHMVLKCKVTYKQMLCAVAIRSAVLIPAIFVALILFELNSSIGLFLFFAVAIWGFTAMQIVMSSCLADQTQNGFVIMISIVIFLFIVITLFIMSKAWTLYLPDVIRAAINVAKSMISDPSQFFTSILQEMY